MGILGGRSTSTEHPSKAWAEQPRRPKSRRKGRAALSRRHIFQGQRAVQWRDFVKWDERLFAYTFCCVQAPLRTPHLMPHAFAGKLGIRA